MAAQSTNLFDQVCATNVKYRMLDGEGPILVAVSGGPDSVSLMAALLESGRSLHVAHVDHMTRRGESSVDAEFVSNLCNFFNVPFHLETRPVAEEAAQRGMSFEEYARDVRYAFFHKVARETGCVAIATGHTANDQAETLLMRLIRGTSPRGAGAIPPVAERVGEDGGDPVRVIRPLIECTREQVLEYIEEKKLSYRTDVSNWNRRFMRNRVRHELIPLLERDYNPELRAALVRFAELERDDNACLESIAARALESAVAGGEIDRVKFAREDAAIQRRIVSAVARHAGLEDCAFDRLDGAVRFIVKGATGARFDVGGGIQFVNGRETTHVAVGEVSVSMEETVLPVPGETQALGYRFIARNLDAPPADLTRYCTPRLQVFDADAIGTPIVVRTRRVGDRFTPLGMTGTKSLGDYFTDAGVPVPYRDSHPIVTGGDAIAWVVGYAISEHAAVTSSSRRWIELEVRDEEASA